MTAAPVACLQGELESALLAEVQPWIYAYSAAHPGATATDLLNDLALVLVAVQTAVARAQANTGKAPPSPDVVVLMEVAWPPLLRATRLTMEQLNRSRVR